MKPVVIVRLLEKNLVFFDQIGFCYILLNRSTAQPTAAQQIIVEDQVRYRDFAQTFYRRNASNGSIVSMATLTGNS